MNIHTKQTKKKKETRADIFKNCGHVAVERHLTTATTLAAVAVLASCHVVNATCDMLAAGAGLHPAQCNRSVG